MIVSSGLSPNLFLASAQDTNKFGGAGGSRKRSLGSAPLRVAVLPIDGLYCMFLTSMVFLLITIVMDVGSAHVFLAPLLYFIFIDNPCFP